MRKERGSAIYSMRTPCAQHAWAAAVGVFCGDGQLAGMAAVGNVNYEA